MAPVIGKPAPGFKGVALVDGQLKDISLEDFAGSVSCLRIRLSAQRDVDILIDVPEMRFEDPEFGGSSVTPT